MKALEPICRALDYIEAHLQAPIAVADVAAAVGYSVYHFCRTFNQVTHHTPYDYLIRRRLAEAARVLLSHAPQEVPAIDVALDYCFNSPETFSRAFRRVYDLSPRQARAAGRLDPWRRMPRLTRAHLEHLHKGAYLKPALVERGATRVAGVITVVPALGGDHARRGERAERGPEGALWAWLEEELTAGRERPIPGDRYGIGTYVVGWERRGYPYMAGVELPPDESVPLGLATQLLPAGEWARFVHKGPTRELDLTLDYIIHTWLPRSGHTLARPLVVEQYTQGMRQADRTDGERAILVPLARN
jgi:AraC family transcriptional regulator